MVIIERARREIASRQVPTYAGLEAPDAEHAVISNRGPDLVRYHVVLVDAKSAHAAVGADECAV